MPDTCSNLQGRMDMHNQLFFSVYQFSEFLPYAVLGYLPFFKENLLISKKKLCVLIASIMIIQFFFNLYIPLSIFPVVNLSFYIFLIIYLVIYYRTIKIYGPILLFVFFTIANYAGIVTGISHALDLYFFPSIQRDNNRYSLSVVLINQMIIAASIPFIHIINKKSVSLMYQNRIDRKIWNSLWVIPFTLDFILVIFEVVFQDESIKIWQTIGILLSMALGSILVYNAIASMFLQIEENSLLKEKVKTANVQLTLEKKSYINLRKYMDEIRKARHDLRHHLSVIETYLEEKNVDALKTYLSDYKNSLPKDIQLIFCDNYAVNAIVTHFVSMAKQEGISASAQLQIPQDLGIPDSDLCVIFGNCLENAFEACQRMDHGERYIRLSSMPQGHSLAVNICNSFNGIIRKEGDAILSSKRINEEGIGISSVQTVCKKYNGIFNFSHSENKFYTSIVLFFP